MQLAPLLDQTVYKRLWAIPTVQPTPIDFVSLLIAVRMVKSVRQALHGGVSLGDSMPSIPKQDCSAMS